MFEKNHVFLTQIKIIRKTIYIQIEELYLSQNKYKCADEGSNKISKQNSLV